MKLWGIYRFELGYQLRRAWPWAFGAVILVAAFFLARDNSLADALYEDFPLNAPFAIAKSTVIATLLWLMVAGAIAGEAGARDIAIGMHPLLFAAPITKRDYLAGRFLAALTLNVVLLLLAQAGIAAGIYAPGVEGATVAPFRLAAYVTAFAYLSLPNAIFGTAIQFWLAVRTGRPMAAYLASFLLFFAGFFIATFVRSVLRPKLGMLLDPIGINYVVDGLAHEWTTFEKKVRLLTFDGIVLHNRLFWLALGGVALAATYARFHFVHRVASEWSLRRRAHAASDDRSGFAQHDVARSLGVPIRSVPLDNRTLTFQLRQTLAIAAASFRTLALSWPGLMLLIVVPLFMVLVVLQQMSALGTPLLPITALVLREMTAPLSNALSRWVIVPPLIAYFAGELVWRERDAGLGEISDAFPGSDWPPLLGKFLGLSLMLALFMATLAISGLIAQSISSYHTFELGLYARTLFGLQLPEYLLFAVVALSLHIALTQKHLGHFACLLAYAYIALLAGLFGVEHNLLVFGASPSWTYTPMRGFGPSVAPWAWFKLYWSGWAILLLVTARLLWMRGKEDGLQQRLQIARRRLRGTTRSVAALGTVASASLGGFILYNTNVRHEFLSIAEQKDRMAEYERRYGRFEHIPQPRLSGAKLSVDIHPRERSVLIRGAYHLVNRSSSPIDTIQVTTGRRGADTRDISFDRPALLLVDDKEHSARLYALPIPLEPNDSLQMTFAVRVEPHGFANNGTNPAVTERGTFFTNADWFPLIGFQSSRALISATDRRALSLPPRPILGALYDDGQDASPRSDGVAFEVVMSTDADQVAVAPGDLQRTWIERGRRYFAYATSAPISSEWAFFSARYAVREDRWNDVAIRIYHDPRNTQHLDCVLRSVHASLDYYSQQFGGYRYRHLTIVERPGAPGASAHADPSLIYHGESFAAWTPRPEPGRLDMPYAVMAHEMAHQWPHPYAPVEGLPFLSEGLAWYFGMQQVKESRGEEQLQRLLTFMRGPYPYPVIRRGEPLLRGMDPYMSYRKGPMTMYALSQYAGTPQVNQAIRRIFDTHASPDAPLATTLDLYRQLQSVTPDSLHPLLHDFFEVNTFWQLATERVATTQIAPGTWEVTLDVRARKIVFDSAGVGTEQPLDQWIPVGVFGSAAAGHSALSRALYLKLHRIKSGRQQIRVSVHEEPKLAGIDPHHLIDWEEMEDDDNVRAIPPSALPNPRR